MPGLTALLEQRLGRHGAVGQAQRDGREFLDQQHPDPGFGDRADRRNQAADDHWREPQRQLVNQHVARLGNQGLGQQVTNFQDDITNLNQVLADKRNVLEEQFDNMEQVLAGLQTQQQSIDSLSGDTSSSSSSKSS